ncbi:hypothetical protein BU15DRAFT_12714, partial [Melanogaster broomeanus]
VPMPRYSPWDRENWEKRARRGKRPASDYVVLFELEMAAGQQYGATSCPSVFMSDCIAEEGTARAVMRDAEEPVFALMGDNRQSEIVFKLRWPGYSALQWTRTIPIYVDGMPMTRAQLAHRIASEFRQFVTACDHGAYAFHAPEAQWMVGRSGIPFERMKLSSVWSPEANVWVASVRVV